jgi:hypothetical protein
MRTVHIGVMVGIKPTAWVAGRYGRALGLWRDR